MRRYLTTAFTILTVLAATARQPETTAGCRMPGDGRFVAEHYRITAHGDSVRVNLGDLKITGTASPMVDRFCVPAVFSIPVGRQKPPVHKQFDGRTFISVERMKAVDGAMIVEIRFDTEGQPAGRRRSHTIIPELRDDCGSHAVMPALSFRGTIKERLEHRKKVLRDYTTVNPLPDMNVTVTTGDDNTVRYRVVMPREAWMDHAVLYIHQVTASPAGRERLFSHAAAEAGKGTQSYGHAPAISPSVNLVAPPTEDKLRTFSVDIRLNFGRGRAEIVPELGHNGGELAKISAVFDRIAADPEIEIKNLIVTGYASPDGRYELNRQLSARRADAVARYISGHYGIPGGGIRTESVPEDWDGLRVQIAESDMPGRGQIMAIIDSPEPPDDREQRLRSMGEPWRALVETIFPRLRRVESRIEVDLGQLDTDRLRRLADTDPGLLTHAELFEAATSYPAGSSPWRRIFETIIRQYPAEMTAMINYSAVLIDRGEPEEALRYLEKAASDPDSYNNLGVCHMLLGNMTEAENFLRMAHARGVTEAARNLSELEKTNNANTEPDYK